MPSGPKTNERTVAEQVRRVWQRLNRKPPGALATVALLAAHMMAIMVAIGVPMIIMILVLAGAVDTPATSYFGKIAADLNAEMDAANSAATTPSQRPH